jgi:PBSX family phage terminase large subunit
MIDVKRRAAALMSATATIELGDCYLPLIEGVHRDRFILIEGPRGTGKTFAILCLLMAYALVNPGARILIVRSTRSRLSQSAMQTLENLVFPAFGIKVPGGGGAENRSTYKLPNGSEFILMGLDDMQRTQSVEVAKVYVVEAVEIKDRHVVEALAGALRQAGMPDHQCLVDCNPGAPGHWLNHAAEPVAKGLYQCETREEYEAIQRHNRAPAKPGFWKRMLTRHQDNPHFWDYDTWEYTEAGRQYVDEVLSTMTGSLGVRWKQGRWVAEEGIIYPMFDEDRHVMAPFRIPDGTLPNEEPWPIYVGWDPGFDHPTAILWIAIGKNGCYYIIDEIYRGGRTVKEHCEEVHKKNRGRTVLRYFGDPQYAFSKTAMSEESIAEQARKHGIAMAPWPRTANELAMVNKVRHRLQEGRIKVFSTCTNTINEFQSWKHKRDANGLVPTGDDKFEDTCNDAMDVVKGMVDLNLGFDARPIKVVRA